MKVWFEMHQPFVHQQYFRTFIKYIVYSPCVCHVPVASVCDASLIINSNFSQTFSLVVRHLIKSLKIDIQKSTTKTEINILILSKDIAAMFVDAGSSMGAISAVSSLDILSSLLMLIFHVLPTT